MRKRTVARLALLRDQIRRDEHLLAALGGSGDPDSGAQDGLGATNSVPEYPNAADVVPGPQNGDFGGEGS